MTHSATKIAIVIPAAGASRRMRGTDKLLERVDGQLLLRGVTARACAVSERVVVTVPDTTSPRADAVASMPVTLVPIPDAKNGMSASLRHGVRLVGSDVDGLMILPADMPDITVDDLRAMIAAFTPSMILQATSADGTPGHPVIFPKTLLSDFAHLTGDAGARSILQRNRDLLHHIALPAQHALTDLDTPEAWDAWRADNPGR